MRQIYLIRHAKAQAIAASDKARELAPQGVDDSAKLGRLFNDDFVQPEAIICSDSKRTRQTLEIMSANGLSCATIDFDEGLYHASSSYLSDLIENNVAKTVMIIGHNPSLAILLNELAPADMIAPDLMHFPTGTIACLQINDEATTHNMELKAFVKGANL